MKNFKGCSGVNQFYVWWQTIPYRRTLVTYTLLSYSGTAEREHKSWCRTTSSIVVNRSNPRKIIIKFIRKLRLWKFKHNKIMFKGTRSLSNAICNTHNIFLPEYNWMTEKFRVTWSHTTQRVSPVILKIMGPTYWYHDLDLSGSRDLLIPQGPFL